MTIDHMSLESLGKLCERLQQPPGRIKRAAERAGISPALSLNGVPYYAESVHDRLVEALALPRPRPMA